jgi:hypothetical protein
MGRNGSSLDDARKVKASPGYVIVLCACKNRHSIIRVIGGQSYSKGMIALPRVRLSISFPGLDITMYSVVHLTAACI